MQPVAPVTLFDDVVLLEPLSTDHVEPLLGAVSGARDSFALTRVPATREEARTYVEAALGEQTRGVSVPFATRDVRTGRPGRVVGSTRFMAIEYWTWPAPHTSQDRPVGCADAVEIGSTWLAPDAQHTAINTHAKLLMLAHAFEAWEVRRVMLKTDARNVRSRTAIERIGARFEGVRRAHMPGFDGAVRDTAYYSILASEWPAVKARLHGFTIAR
jgi:RimJ/RimL family protein N-acetyltransferase